MENEPATKPKFLTDLKIQPVGDVVKGVSLGDDDAPSIQISAKIYTSGRSGYIPIFGTLTHPGGKVVPRLKFSVANTENRDEATALLTHTVKYADEVGTYTIKAEIENCTEECEREATFVVVEKK